MAVKIEIKRRAIGPFADQKPQHSDQLRPFFVNSGRVEIVDLDKTCRAHGMRQWACILAELARAQIQHITNSLHRRRSGICAELLIAKDG